MSDNSSSPELTVLGAGVYHGIFLALGIDVDGIITRGLNTMFDRLYSFIPPERQYIFPIFWVKIMIWFLIGVVPTILMIGEVLSMGRTGVYLLIIGIIIGIAMVIIV